MGLLVSLEDANRHHALGSKARMLWFLQRHGYRAPVTWVCAPKAYARYLDGHVELVEELRAELVRIVDPEKQYAVRSSSNVEDQADFSFAGQFKSVLHMRGADSILGAIWSVWSSVQSASVQAYLERHGLQVDGLEMAVIIQEMVPPHVSGVAFSKNPVTGLDEVVVEAVIGSGESLMQEGITPHRWVNKWGRWLSQPAEECEIPLGLVENVTAETKAIAKAYGRPVDLEWVYDGQSVTWVQLREITSLDINLYSNRIAAEVFPGLIKPLIWSVNVPLVNGAWVRLFTELIGPNDIKPEDLSRSFYCRAYFDMGTVGRVFEMLGFPRESLELLMGIESVGPDKPSIRPSGKTFTYLPRMLLFAIDKLGFGRRVDRFLESARRGFQSLAPDDGASLSQRLQVVDRLYHLAQKTAYYDIVVTLLMQLYVAMLKGQLNRLGLSLESLDLTHGVQELEQYDPNVHLTRLGRLFDELDDETQQSIKTGGYSRFRSLPDIELLQQAVERFILEFGHLSDKGTDFSAVPWRENPDLVLEMVSSFCDIDAPFSQRQAWDELALPRLQRWLMEPVYRRARKYVLYREIVSSLYTYGYGLFRTHFLALGSQLVEGGWISSKDDVFYLHLDELRHLAQSGSSHDLRGKIAERKQEMDRCASLNPPAVIYGDQEVELSSSALHRLEGTPTSRGTYSGPARVIKGMGGFAKMEEGDVLIIPYSDVGWTPLFAKAGAVVAESGGILSHSSIIAREYGIPAVVSVRDACQIEDGKLVTVDGFQGVVSVED